MMPDDRMPVSRRLTEQRLPPHLRNLTTVAVALVSRNGDLIDAGRGFRDLLSDGGFDADALDIRDLFVNPRFAEVAARRQTPDEGIVYRGILNLGSAESGVRSLHGTIFASEGNLLVVAERHIVQLEQAAAEILKLNEELADRQRVIIGLQRTMERREAETRGALADRESLLDVLSAGAPRRRETRRSTDRATDRPEGSTSPSGELLMEWTEDLSVGITLIDRQHGELISYYHAFVHALQSEDAARQARPALRTLIDATRGHFADEERIMGNIGYPDFLAHREEHTRLLQDAEDFMRNIGVGLSLGDCASIAKYVRYWLLKHIKEHDRKIRTFITR